MGVRRTKHSNNAASKYQGYVRHIQHFGEPPLQPRILSPPAALGAVAVAARVVLPMTVATLVAFPSLTAKGFSATGNDAPPGFGLGSVQGVGCQIR